MLKTMILSEKKLLVKNIEEAETKLHLNLPNVYKTFLLKYNGGSPEECAIDFDGNKLKIKGDDIKYFFSLGGKKTNDIVFKSLSNDFSIPDGLIFLANTHLSNFFLLSLRNDSYGEVFYKDHEVEDTLPFTPTKKILPESIVKVSDSFDEFIANLYDPDE